MTVHKTTKLAAAVKNAASHSTSHPDTPVPHDHHHQHQKSGGTPDSGAHHSRSSSRAAELVRKAAKSLVMADRLESSEKKLRRRYIAPFSIVSPYQKVRALLDPIRDKHLLGGDDFISARGKKKVGDEVQRRPPPESPHSRVNAARSTTAFEPESEVPLQSVMVPFDENAPSSLDNADESTKTVIPDGREVALLPLELATTFYTVAIERLKKLLTPRLLYIAHMKKVRAMEREMTVRAIRPTPDVVKKFKLFSQWTPEVLNKLVDSLKYRCIESNRFIWYTGEPGGTMGVVILSHGTAKSFRNANRGMGQKRLNAENAVLLGTHQAGHMFNEYSFMTEEPQMRHVKTVTRCDLWCLDKGAFEECLAMLSESTRHAMAQLAFHRRQKMIPDAYFFTPLLLRNQSHTFAKNSDAVLNQVINNLKPLAVHPGFVLAQEGETPACMYFLRRGKVGIYREVNGELTHIRSIYAPTTLLESCVLHRQENMDLMKAMTECDFLTIAMEDMHNIMSQFPLERDILLEVSREEKMKVLSQQQMRFRPLMFQVPILRHLLEAEQITTLSHLFEGKVYPAMEIITSKADMCDKVIILTKGKVSLGVKGATWLVGEAIGFTCLIPHRWALSAVALQQCECIELKREFLAAFLEDTGKIRDALEITEAVLFPEKFKLDERERVMQERGIEVTPALRRLHRSGHLPPLRGINMMHPHNQQQLALNSSQQPEQGAHGTLMSYFQQHRQQTPEETRKARLDQIIGIVVRDIGRMVTPRMYPVGTASSGPVSVGKDGPHVGLVFEQGFVKARPTFPVTELAVPGGLYAPTMGESDKEEALSSALFANKRDPVRRVQRITPFLMVKQR